MCDNPPGTGLRSEIAAAQLAAGQRGRDLDALHLAWCDGRCPHRAHAPGPDLPGRAVRPVRAAPKTVTRRRPAGPLARRPWWRRLWGESAE